MEGPPRRGGWWRGGRWRHPHLLRGIPFLFILFLLFLVFHELLRPVLILPSAGHKVEEVHHVSRTSSRYLNVGPMTFLLVATNCQVVCITYAGTFTHHFKTVTMKYLVGQQSDDPIWILGDPHGLVKRCLAYQDITTPRRKRNQLHHNAASSKSNCNVSQWGLAKSTLFTLLISP